MKPQAKRLEHNLGQIPPASKRSAKAKIPSAVESIVIRLQERIKVTTDTLQELVDASHSLVLDGCPDCVPIRKALRHVAELGIVPKEMTSDR